MEQDRSAIQVVSDQVDGAARHFDAVVEGLRDGVHAATEGGQQRRVSIQDLAAIRGDEFWNQDFVEACQNNQLYPRGLQRCE